MKKSIVILGCGPRGLTAALQALKYKDKYNIYLIDPSPISTWKYPHMVVDMKMRSPITFDLTTFQKDLQTYSLSNYLGYNTEPVFTQQEVEKNSIYCKREEFLKYLQYILNILQKEGVTLIKQKPTVISKDEIVFKSTKLQYNYLIIATGKFTEEPVIPNYIKHSNINFCKDVYSNNWVNKKVYVLGSGQFAAEIVNYLITTTNKHIFWVQSKEPKVEQYPAPSFKNWGLFSALSNYYYKNLSIKQTGEEYLKRVKSWGPSITPYINNKLLKNIDKYTVIKPNDIKIESNSEFILALGRRQNINNLPLDFSISKGYSQDKVPRLNRDFSSYSNPNIYFTGLLSLELGGPNQGSLISCGETAKVILNSIHGVV